MRRSHQALAVPNSSPCPQCGAARESHTVCRECGHYRGRQIFEVEREDEA